jgi:hypothetical protein
MQVLPPTIKFNYGDMEIWCDYCDKSTSFHMKYETLTPEQSFVNIYGDPSVLTLLSSRDASSLDEAYPDEVLRIRFVKAIMYIWVTYHLGVSGKMGYYSKLFDAGKLFEDYADKEMVKVVVIPILKSIRTGSKHITDISKTVVEFATTASLELENFLLSEIESRGIVYNEVEFGAEFQERLNMINSQISMKAVQALNAQDIDNITVLGDAIENLKTHKVDLPEFENLRAQFKELCGKIEVLGAGQVKLLDTKPQVDVEQLVEQIRSQKTHIEDIVQNFNSALRRIEDERKKEKLMPSSPQPQPPTQEFADPVLGRVAQNMSRRHAKIIQKMLMDNDI